MVFRAALGASFFCLGVASAQLDVAVEAELSSKESAVEELLSERGSQEALEKEVSEARLLGVAEQVILEARFLFHVDRAEDAQIAGLLHAFRKQKEKFKLTDSAIFGEENDWLAVTEYVEALAALEEGDMEGFKGHITEAFWLNPKQGVVFTPYIERIRLMDAMKSVRVDFESEHIDIFSGEEVSLNGVLGECRGLLLHFWSPWSRESEATLADFLTTADHLILNDIAVVSVLPETSKKVIHDAKTMLLEIGAAGSGSWVVDTEEVAISDELKVESVPVVVLLGKEGEVIFNGHPTEDEFWKSLEKLNSEILRPEARDE